MQAALGAAQALYGDDFLAVDGRQEADAGIHGAQPQVVAVGFRNDHGAGAAIPLRTTLLRAFEATVFAQKLQHRPRRVVDDGLDDLAVQHEANRVAGHALQLPL